jgi:hypothetical protein
MLHGNLTGPRPSKWARRTHPAFTILIAFLWVGTLSAQGQAAGDPLALVRRASHNEAATHPDAGRVRYKLNKIDDKGNTTKELVETKDGEVARLIAIDNKPLNPQQNQKELDRLNNLLAHPEIQEHRREREQEDSGRGDEMVRLLPDAFLYQFEGMVKGPNGPAYRLSFKPNPSFDPPDREAEVYHGMVGELWIDKGQERLVKLDAHLIADVEFGWGILGRLYKGGSILVEQADVGHHHWEVTHMHLNLTGKALMFKPLNFTTTEDSTDFEPVPTNITYQDAIRMLEAPGSSFHAASASH